MKLLRTIAIFLGQAAAASMAHTMQGTIEESSLIDNETKSLFAVATNELLLNHSNFFRNENDTFGRIYKIGDDPYTLDHTPLNLNYKAYAAVGYGLANSVIVKNENGFVVIDTGETSGQADDMIDEFVKEGILSEDDNGYVEPPLRAIIYTHNHIDHTGGALGFLRRSKLPPCPQKNDGVDETYKASADCVEVIAHTTIEKAIINTSTRTGKVINARSAYMYGTFLLPPNSAVNNGIGPPVNVGVSAWHPPSKTFSQTMLLIVESMGIQLQLRYVPSETSDEIIAFLPDCANGKKKSVQGSIRSLSNQGRSFKTCILEHDTPPQELGTGLMQAAEAVQGPSFPNLYSLRGTTFRNPLTWYQSVDVLRLYEPWAFLPSHGVPIMGYNNIQVLLLNFRDAIAYVHDQTLRFIRSGFVPDEIVEMVQIPPYVLDNLEKLGGLPIHETPAPIDPRDYLRTLYGSVPQSIRELYCGYLGWNTGDPTLFKPLPPVDRANRYVELMGGPAAVLAAAQAAYKKGLAGEGEGKQEFQWAAELLINVIRASTAKKVVKNAARVLKAKAFLQLASNDSTDETELEQDTFSLNPNWRNWFITGAAELLLTVVSDGEYSFPYSNLALISPEIQAGLSNPGKWVQSWSWRFNSTSTDLDGSKYGWKFLPDETFWGTEAQYFILEVDRMIVRFISDPIEVSKMWLDELDIAVEIDRPTFLTLVGNDAELFNVINQPLSELESSQIMEPNRFAITLRRLIEEDQITLLKGAPAEASGFYGKEYFDIVGAWTPSIVGR